MIALTVHHGKRLCALAKIAAKYGLLITRSLEKSH
jgi:hypothetical protein